MSELRYTTIDASMAEQMAELERIAFPNLDPIDQYDADDLRELARVFPDGNFVCLDGDRVVGMGLGVYLDFDFDDPDHSLIELTGEGGWEGHRDDGAWYYGTDISVLPDYRGRGIGQRLYELRKDVVRRDGKLGIVAGGVIPGYADHKHEMSAAEYIERVVAGALYDPTLTFQLENGFEARGPIANYLIDPTVDNWAVLIVWHNDSR